MNILIYFLLSLMVLSSPLSNADDTCVRTVLSDVAVELGDQQLTLDHEITTTSFVSDHTAYFSIKADIEDGPSVSSDIRFIDDSIRICFGNSDHYYTIPYTALFETVGLMPDDNSDKLVSLVSDPQNCSVFLGEYLDAFLAENAVNLSESEITVGEDTLAATNVQLKVSPIRLAAVLDRLRKSENTAVAEGTQALLNILGNNELTSFTQILTGTAEIPVTFTIAAGEDPSVGRQSWQCALPIKNGTLNLYGVMDTRGNIVDISFTCLLSVDKNEFSCNAAVNIVCPESNDNAYTFTGTISYSDKQADSLAFTTADSAQIDDSAINSTVTDLSFSGTIADGIPNIEITGKIVDSENVSDTEDNDPIVTDHDISVAVVGTSLEDGSLVTDYAISYTALAEIGNVGLSWRTTSTAMPFVDPFAGSEIIVDPANNSFGLVLLAADAIEFADNFKSVIESMTSEGFDWGPVLQLDFDADSKELLDTPEFTSESDDDTDDNEAPDDPDEDEFPDDFDENDSPDGSDEDEYSDYDEPLTVNTLEEAAEIYTGTIPAFTVPEGYAVTDISVDPYSLSIDLNGSDEDTYMGLYLFSDMESEEDMPIFFENEDGTVYAADLLVDGVEVDVYFSDLPRNRAESILKEMGLM